MTLRIAIAGTGWGAKVQAPAFRLAGYEVAALWGRTPDKAKLTADSLSIPFHTSDFNALLEQKNIDLVSIVTPPHTHAQMAADALGAGKHVLCEKPTACNADEARLMLSAARANPNLLALIDHELRLAPARQKMRDLIRDGYVGEIYHVGGKASSLSSLTRLWNWWSEKEKGGGLWGAIGSHFIDMLSWLTGQRVTSISGELRTFIAERIDSAGTARPVTTDDYCAFNMRLGESVSGTLNLSIVTPGAPLHRVVIVGSRGTLLYQGDTLSGCRAGSAQFEELAGASHIPNAPDSVANDDWGRGTYYLARAIAEKLEQGDDTALRDAATFEDGLYIQQVLDAGHRAHQSGQWEQVAPCSGASNINRYFANG